MNISTQSHQDKTRDKTGELMNYIFSQLIGIFGEHKWVTPEGIEQGRIQYIKAFIESGLTNLSNIEHGLKKCRQDSSLKFMPTPAQFISMCKPTPEELGIPSIKQAYDEAVKNSSRYQEEKTWSHIVVEHAWKATGAYMLANTNNVAAYPLFERNYQISTRMFIEGKLSEIHVALPAEVTSYESLSEADRELIQNYMYFQKRPQYFENAMSSYDKERAKMILERMKRNTDDLKKYKPEIRKASTEVYQQHMKSIKDILNMKSVVDSLKN